VVAKVVAIQVVIRRVARVVQAVVQVKVSHQRGRNQVAHQHRGKVIKAVMYHQVQVII
jgi:hypothetical protein